MSSKLPPNAENLGSGAPEMLSEIAGDVAGRNIASQTTTFNQRELSLIPEQQSLPQPTNLDASRQDDQTENPNILSIHPDKPSARLDREATYPRPQRRAGMAKLPDMSKLRNSMSALGAWLGEKLKGPIVPPAIGAAASSVAAYVTNSMYEISNSIGGGSINPSDFDTIKGPLLAMGFGALLPSVMKTVAAYFEGQKAHTLGQSLTVNDDDLTAAIIDSKKANTVKSPDAMVLIDMPRTCINSKTIPPMADITHTRTLRAYARKILTEMGATHPNITDLQVASEMSRMIESKHFWQKFVGEVAGGTAGVTAMAVVSTASLPLSAAALATWVAVRALKRLIETGGTRPDIVERKDGDGNLVAMPRESADRQLRETITENAEVAKNLTMKVGKKAATEGWKLSKKAFWKVEESNHSHLRAGALRFGRMVRNNGGVLGGLWLANSFELFSTLTNQLGKFAGSFIQQNSFFSKQVVAQLPTMTWWVAAGVITFGGGYWMIKNPGKVWDFVTSPKKKAEKHHGDGISPQDFGKYMDGMLDAREQRESKKKKENGGGHDEGNH